MGKRILRVYLAKNDTPYSAAYAKLELPASPWEMCIRDSSERLKALSPEGQRKVMNVLDTLVDELR